MRLLKYFANFTNETETRSQDTRVNDLVTFMLNIVILDFVVDEGVSISQTHLALCHYQYLLAMRWQYLFSRGVLSYKQHTLFVPDAFVISINLMKIHKQILTIHHVVPDYAGFLLLMMGDKIHSSVAATQFPYKQGHVSVQQICHLENGC